MCLSILLVNGNVRVCTPGVLMNSCFNYPLFFILDIKRTCLNEEYVSGY